MRGVHVDEHQAVARLREDVDAVQLRERVPERMVGGVVSAAAPSIAR